MADKPNSPPFLSGSQKAPASGGHDYNRDPKGPMPPNGPPPRDLFENRPTKPRDNAPYCCPDPASRVPGKLPVATKDEPAPGQPPVTGARRTPFKVG